jgi:hypothetical protein
LGLTLKTGTRRRERCKLAILSWCHSICNTALALFAQMVLLHEEHLRRFVHVWRMALANSVSLPATAAPYASLDALGRHVLSAAGGYMIWICEMLTLPDPGIHHAPT